MSGLPDWYTGKRSKYFSYSKCGGTEGALAAANKWVSVIGPVLNKAPRPAPLKTGVKYMTMARFFDATNQLTNMYFKIAVPVNGGIVQKVFPIKKLGYDKAWRKAIKDLRGHGVKVRKTTVPPAKPSWASHI